MLNILSSENKDSYKRRFRWTGILSFASMFVISFIIYANTAFRTVTWWGTGELAAASVTLGISYPPGSLIATILGWLVTRLPLSASPIFILNIFAGLLAAVTGGLITYVAWYLIRTYGAQTTSKVNDANITVIVGIVLGGLTFAFGETLWLYAVKYTPYIITPLFTVMILYAMLRWWERAGERDSFRWLFILSLLFGLDFSVHRTNFVLLPALLLWVLLRYPKTIITLKSWIYGLGGFLLGLAFHLLLIPIAIRKPFINSGNPDSLSRFWDYIALKQQGGGFLLGLFPRKAPFWSVQVMDFLDALGKNFLPGHGVQAIFGAIPLLLALIGLVALWRRNRKLCMGFVFLFLISSAVTILYFNIPANFFRSFDRHYLPCMVIIAVVMTYGAGVIAETMWRKGNYALTGLIILILLSAPFTQVIHNYHRLDGSNNYFTEDYCYNILDSLPPDAILFTRGDNDTFPLWYLQVGEHVRPDVTVLNLSLLNTKWYVRQTIEHEPDFPLGLTDADIDNLQFQPWRDTTIAIPFAKNYDPSLSLDSIPDSAYLHLPPTISDKYLRIQDWALYHIIKENAWRRPIYFTSPPRWLQSYCQLEGLTSRLMPVNNVSPNIEKLKENLFKRYRYRGYADSSIPVELSTRWIAQSLYKAFITVAQIEYETGNAEGCLRTKEKMLAVLPLERMKPPEQMRKYIETLCKPEEATKEQ